MNQFDLASVLVILTNYKRHRNTLELVKTWKNQDYKNHHVVVVNNVAGEAGGTSYPKFYEAYDEWRFERNAGPPCRLAPALLDHDHEYILFADDDLTPGVHVLRWMVETAKSVKDKFATIGYFGRIINPEKPVGQRYIRSGSPRSPYSPSRTDITCRIHLVRTEMVRHALMFKWALIKRFGKDALPIVSVHDDFLLCCGIQSYTQQPSYLTLRSTNPDHSHREVFELPDGGIGVWKRPNHFDERNRAADMALELGWTPIRE